MVCGQRGVGAEGEGERVSENGAGEERKKKKRLEGRVKCVLWLMFDGFARHFFSHRQRSPSVLSFTFGFEGKLQPPSRSPSVPF